MLKPCVLSLLAVGLLSSCSHLPAPLQAVFHPAQQVRHGADDPAAAYYQLGRYHHERGELEQALTAYNYASARDPFDAGPRIGAAVIHAQQGRLAQARAMLLAVSTDYPGLPQALNNLGYVYHLQGEYEAAAAVFRQVLAERPEDERARVNLRLAEAAMASPLPAPAAPALRPATPTGPAASPAPARSQSIAAAPAAAEDGLRLVRVAANVYELRTASPVPAAARSPALAPGKGSSLAGRAGRQNYQLEISNGHGANGLAKRFRQALAAHGITARRLTNAKPFGQPSTRIEYRPGFADAARALQAALGGRALLRTAREMAAPADLRLVLGRDADLAPVLAARPPANRPLLTSTAPTGTD